MTLAVEATSATTTVADAVEQAARQPYEYVRRELVEPDWRRFPGWRDVTEAQWRDAQWQRAHCVKNIRQLRVAHGRPARRALLRRPCRRPGAAGDDVHAGPAADAQHDGAERRARRVHRRVLCGPDPPLHDPGRVGPGPAVAEPPVRHPRLAARGRDVGRRGADPPLPHEGAGRTAVHLSAVLRPLHPDGPGRQLHKHGGQAQALAQAGRPAGRDDRLSQAHARRAGRGGLRR